MTQHLTADLDKLKKQLLYLAAQVEDAVRKAIAALLERNKELALDVVSGDREIDEREVEIEEECLKLLALHQPVATDLRFIAAVLKIDNDLERIGDLAVSIAKRAAFLSTAPHFPVPAQMKAMMEQAVDMVRQSLDAFVRADVAKATAVLEADDAIDHIHRAMGREFVAAMEANPEHVAAGMQLFSVSKSLERIADHATNIAEDVIYLVDGAIIRHGLGGYLD